MFIPSSQSGGVASANMLPRLDGTGRLAFSLLPEHPTDTVLGRALAGAGDPTTLAFGDPAQALGALATPTLPASKGLVYTVGTAPGGAALSFQSDYRAVRARFDFVPAGSTVIGVGTGLTLPAGLTNGNDALGRALTVDTSTVIATEREIRDGATNLAQARHNPIMMVRLAMGSNITSQRFWIGWIATSAATTNSDTLANVNGSCCLRYSSAVDTNWTLCSWDGTTQSTADTGLPVIAGAHYLLVVYTADAGVTWRTSVYNVGAGTSGSAALTANVPSVTQNIGPTISLTNTIAAARSYVFYGMSGESQDFA